MSIFDDLTYPAEQPEWSWDDPKTYKYKNAMHRCRWLLLRRLHYPNNDNNETYWKMVDRIRVLHNSFAYKGDGCMLL